MQKMQWCTSVSRYRHCTANGRGQKAPGDSCKALSGACLALLLTACTTTSEPKIVIKEVKVPVTVPCPIDTTEPDYLDTKAALIEAAKKGSDVAFALVIAGRAQRDAMIAGLKAQAEACGG